MFQLNCELAQLLNPWYWSPDETDEIHLVDEFNVIYCIINSVVDDILQWADDYKWKRGNMYTTG